MPHPKKLLLLLPLLVLSLTLGFVASSVFSQTTTSTPTPTPKAARLKSFSVHMQEDGSTVAHISTSFVRTLTDAETGESEERTTTVEFTKQAWDEAFKAEFPNATFSLDRPAKAVLKAARTQLKKEAEARKATLSPVPAPS
jgi:hypothetical protein